MQEPLDHLFSIGMSDYSYSILASLFYLDVDKERSFSEFNEMRKGLLQHLMRRMCIPSFFLDWNNVSCVRVVLGVTTCEV